MKSNEIIKYEYPNDMITYKKVVEYLRVTIPEFWENKIMDDIDLPTVIYDDFALWFKEQFNSKNKNPELIQRCCQLIQELLDKGNEEVQNLVIVSIFEVMVDDFENFRNYFDGKALEFLDKVKRGWLKK